VCSSDLEVLPLEQVREEELLSPTELQRYEQPPIVVMNPERNRFGRVLAGINLSPSYMAVLIALVVYTAAFIGEIVRAGIQAVPYGQIEAARAVGLSSPQTLRMIILPQALRVIIPPMGNQYLNLSKNSSLATFVAYADTYQVGQTIMNQSGQSITGFFLILLVYLTMSLLISLVMNLVNSRFQLVTR
jgi:general L-amino acid transport system permease protein